MKKYIITKFLFPALLLTTLAANGDEIAITEAEIAAIQNQSQAEMPKPPSFYEHNNRMVVFNLSCLTYERTKINALYFGINYCSIPHTLVFGKYRYNFLGRIKEAELRIGYNIFYNGKDHLTPIIGIGIFNDYHALKLFVTNDGIVFQPNLPPILYGTLGFLYDHEFNSVFNLGFNVKGVIGESIKNKDWEGPIDWGSIVGFDIALPITFRFGHQRHWDLRIQPFGMYVHGDTITRRYVGFQNTIGYRF